MTDINDSAKREFVPLFNVKDTPMPKIPSLRHYSSNPVSALSAWLELYCSWKAVQQQPGRNSPSVYYDKILMKRMEFLSTQTHAMVDDADGHLSMPVFKDDSVKWVDMAKIRLPRLPTLSSYRTNPAVAMANFMGEICKWKHKQGIGQWGLKAKNSFEQQVKTMFMKCGAELGDNSTEPFGMQRQSDPSFDEILEIVDSTPSVMSVVRNSAGKSSDQPIEAPCCVNLPLPDDACDEPKAKEHKVEDEAI